MGRRLAETIVLRHPSTGEPVVLEAGTLAPAWAAERISNPDVWAQGPDVGAETTPGQPATSQPAGDEPVDPAPARPAANASKADWVAYAEHLGVDVPADATRAVIIDLTLVRLDADEANEADASVEGGYEPELSATDED